MFITSTLCGFHIRPESASPSSAASSPFKIKKDYFDDDDDDGGGDYCVGDDDGVGGYGGLNGDDDNGDGNDLSS